MAMVLWRKGVGRCAIADHLWVAQVPRNVSNAAPVPRGISEAVRVPCGILEGVRGHDVRTAST